MIRNEKQLSRAKKRLNEVKDKYINFKRHNNKEEAKAFDAPILEEIRELQIEIEEFEGLLNETLEQAVEYRLKKPTLIENISELLTKLRIAAGLTQEELANRLGWQQSNVARFESGTNHSQTIAKVAEYLEGIGVWLYVVPEMDEIDEEDSYYKKVSRPDAQSLELFENYIENINNSSTDINDYEPSSDTILSSTYLDRFKNFSLSRESDPSTI